MLHELKKNNLQTKKYDRNKDIQRKRKTWTFHNFKFSKEGGGLLTYEGAPTESELGSFKGKTNLSPI